MKVILVIGLLCVVGALAYEPINLAWFQKNLGKGFDVSWSEFLTFMELYSENAPIFWASQGFKNVRIRMNQMYPNDTFMQNLANQVKDCAKNGIYPIIAYQGHSLQESTDHEQNKRHLTEWWGNMSEYFQGYTYKLAFNILIEISGTYKQDYTRINDFYVSVLAAIRAHDPSRIVIFPPVRLSNPDELEHLVVPGGSEDQYTMVEWHFFASGPNLREGGKKYWVDGQTWEERNNVLGPIQVAYNWSVMNSEPTWVGAWMPGNYNEGNDYDIAHQVDFASFMVKSLDAKNIPWSVNAGKKFYDYELNQWLTYTTDAGSLPVVHAMLDPESIALYQENKYGGNFVRLSVGEYDETDLISLGMTVMDSVMIPIDFQVTFFSEAGFQGTSSVYTKTKQYLDMNQIKSLKVAYVEFTG